MSAIATPAVPEVSLISSWYSPASGQPEAYALLPGLSRALREGIQLLDLYFLSHTDISWYRRALGGGPSAATDEPHSFAGNLVPEQLRTVRDRLNASLVEWYGGRKVGRRPRLAAFATYFPNIGLLQKEESSATGHTRSQAVRALRNTMCLARLLGCRHVEIVGGPGVPSLAEQGGLGHGLDAEGYRRARRAQIVRSLYEACNLDLFPASLRALIDRGEPAPGTPRVLPDNLPFLCVELEPGPGFLINSLNEFVLLRDEFREYCKDRGRPAVAAHLRLNLDVAHAFLLGLTPEDLVAADLVGCLGHVHMSDHAGHHRSGGSHAADLVPGSFHSFAKYEPWLRLAIQRTREDPFFSGAIAIEMEACYDVNAALDAVGITRRWLQALSHRNTGGRGAAVGHATPGEPTATPGLRAGALLVVDIGNSTRSFFGSRRLSPARRLQSCLKLDRFVAELCGIIHAHGGSVMSFTGDGFIALFEAESFAGGCETAGMAQGAARLLCDRIAKRLAGSTQVRKPRLTVRAALHWGEAYVPPTGALRDQVIGDDVVCAARICDWLGRIIEPATPPSTRRAVLGATDRYVDALASADRDGWAPWGSVELKGLPGARPLFLLQIDQPGASDSSRAEAPERTDGPARG